MVDGDDGAPLESRPVGLSDLVSLRQNLNREGAQYVVIGGMAIIQAGLTRATEDIDLLVSTAPENLQRVLRALLELPRSPFANLEFLWKTKQTLWDKDCPGRAFLAFRK